MEAAQKLDPILGSEGESITSGPHDTNFANKLDPRVDSENDHWDTNTNAQASRSGTFARRGTEPVIRRSVSDEIETQAAHGTESNDEIDRCTRRASLSNDAAATQDEPNSGEIAHKSKFLNLLDSRVDRDRARQMRSSGS